MIYILGIVQFVIISCVCIYEFTNRSPVVYMWATLLIMFGAMHLVVSFTGDHEYSGFILIQASIFVIGFCIIYIIVRYITMKMSRKRAMQCIVSNAIVNQLSRTRDYSSILLFAFAAFTLARLLPYIRRVGGILNTSWGGMVAYGASLSYLNSRQILMPVYFALSGVSVVLWMRHKRVLSAITMVIIIVDTIITTNRIEILPFLCAIIYMLLIREKKVSYRVVIVSVCLSVITIYLIYALRVFRHYGTLSNFLSNVTFKTFNERLLSYIENDNGELGLRRHFYYFISRNNQFVDFGKGNTYLRMLMVYIPSNWSLGLKPADFAQSMGAAIGMLPGGSTHPTLFGDCYANFGWFGTLLGIFWALYANVSDWIVTKQRTPEMMILTYILFACSYVIIGRGSVYNSFTTIAWGLPLLYVLYFIIKKVKIRLCKVHLKRHIV